MAAWSEGIVFKNYKIGRSTDTIILNASISV